MRSKTMLVGLSAFRCDGKKSMHGRPSWESERTKEFAAWCPWCRDVSRECCFNERAGECGVIRFTTSTKFFCFWTKQN